MLVVFTSTLLEWTRAPHIDCRGAERVNLQPARAVSAPFLKTLVHSHLGEPGFSFDKLDPGQFYYYTSLASGCQLVFDAQPPCPLPIILDFRRSERLRAITGLLHFLQNFKCMPF